jgi:hypothetical protein
VQIAGALAYDLTVRTDKKLRYCSSAMSLFVMTCPTVVSYL